MAVAETPVLVGPTGIGKTAVALALAARWDMEVVSADSRQVYRGLPIGTAQPTAAEQRRLPHHGVAIIDPGHRYSAGRFARDAVAHVAAVRARGRLPVVVGGTGLYVRALAEGLFREPAMDPVRRRALEAFTAALDALDTVRWAGRLDPAYAGGGRQRAMRSIEVALLTGRPLSHWQRVAREAAPITPWYVVLTAPRPVLHQRIAERAAAMVRDGLLDEVDAVLRRGVPPTAPGLDSVGVRDAVDVLAGRRSAASLAEAMAIGTRQYAKRQETWFRHQLPGSRLMLDATRPPEALAEAIASAWQERPH